MKDTRGWLQKFGDQIYGAPRYTFYLTPEQANKTNETLNALTRKDWRTKAIIETLERAMSHPMTILSQQVVTVTLDTSDSLRILGIAGLTKANIQSRKEDNGFISKTYYPKNLVTKETE